MKSSDPRFIKEYKNYCVNSIKENNFMRPEIRKEKLLKIEKCYRAFSIGWITINETMRTLSEIAIGY